MGFCYLILGSNLGDRLKNIEKAKVQIEELIGAIVKQSSLYESEPWGYSDAVSYFNQAIYLQTNLEAIDVLRKCLFIETAMGRVRTKDSFEARIIDIDILFYDDKIFNSEELILPHPRINQRRFVLEPLCEINASLVHPISNKTIKKHLAECVDTCWVKKLT